MREIETQGIKAEIANRALGVAEENNVENASIMRKQELMFAILKQLASVEVQIIGEGVVEILQDGFAFLRSADANYLPGPDDIYVSPSRIRRLGIEPAIRSKASSGAPRRENGISRCLNATPSTSRTRRRPGTRSISTT